MTDHISELQRSSSAPVACFRSREERCSNKVVQDDLLTPWNTDSSENEFKQLNKQQKRKPTQKSCSSTSLAKKNQTYSKYKSPKWHIGTNSDIKRDSYLFRHYTGMHQYMEDYRSIKIDNAKKLMDKDSHDLLHTQSTNDDNYIDIQQQSRQTVSLQEYQNDSVYYGYRLEGKKERQISNKILHQRDISGLNHSFKDKIGRNLRSVETRVVTSDTRQKLPKYNLSKCEGVFFPYRPMQHPSYLNTEQILQCRKLSDLSLKPSKSSLINTTPLSKDKWKPQPFHCRGSLQSPQEQKKYKRLASDIKYNDYSQIIKRVLDHYDPAKNPVRSKGATDELKSSTYLLAST